MVEDGRRSKIPGIEKYSLFSHTEKDYRRYYNEAFRVLSNPAMPENVRSESEKLSVAYASLRTEETFSLEEKIKTMSLKIIKVGNKIMLERDWSNLPEDNNFAWQLQGRSENAKSLRLSSKTGKPLHVIRSQIGEERPGNYPIAQFSSISDLLIGASQEQSFKELMFDFYGDLAQRLGFKEPKKRGEDVYEARHPTEPFIISFCDLGQMTEEGLEVREALLDYLNLEFSPPKRDITITVNLYHQEKSRIKK